MQQTEARAEARRRLISEGYQALQERFHQERKDYGVSGQKYAEQIAGLAEALGVDDLLDYGAGKETLAQALPQYAVHSYDPAVPHLSEEPVAHDLVACTDVMEHIEPELVDNVLDHIASLTKKIVWFQIATTPATKTLPDGRNAHICVEPAEWWLAKLVDRWDVIRYEKMGDKAVLITCAVRQEQ
jgi:hypothetical protein